MSDFREEEKLGKLYDTQLTRRLMKYLRPYRWQVFCCGGDEPGSRRHGDRGAISFWPRRGSLHRARWRTVKCAKRVGLDGPRW